MSASHAKFDIGEGGEGISAMGEKRKLDKVKPQYQLRMSVPDIAVS
jgi:hypothetical protein